MFFLTLPHTAPSELSTNLDKMAIEIAAVIPQEDSTTAKPTLDAGYSAKRAIDASARFDALKHSHQKRDPHDLPDFSSSDPLTSPVLFLPPLLSSLPHGLSHTPAPSPDQAPLTTETHLPDIDPASLSLHKALHYFSPLNPHYATQPYAESFNWDALNLPEDQEREWYVVAFRSKRKAGSDSGCETSFPPTLFSIGLSNRVCANESRSQHYTKPIEELTKRPCRTAG